MSSNERLADRGEIRHLASEVSAQTNETVVTRYPAIKFLANHDLVDGIDALELGFFLVLTDSLGWMDQVSELLSRMVTDAMINGGRGLVPLHSLGYWPHSLYVSDIDVFTVQLTELTSQVRVTAKVRWSNGTVNEADIYDGDYGPLYVRRREDQ